MIKQAIMRGVLASLLLTVLEAAWYYVANAASMTVGSRELLKTLLLISGVLLVLVVAAAEAVRFQTRWVRPTVLVTGVALVASNLLLFPMLSALGVHHGNNSALLGESGWIRNAAGVIGLLLFLLVAIGIGVAAGWAARVVVSRLRRRHGHSQRSAAR